MSPRATDPTVARSEDDAMLRPVVIVGAGPTGVTAATLLAAQGVPSLVLDRWPEVYPQPRAVHLDDEVYRILDRMGVADRFAAISRPSQGLRLVDHRHRVLVEFDRSGPAQANGHPRASMFDQPALEQLLRDNLLDQPLVDLRGGVEVRSVVVHPHHSELEIADLATGTVSTIRARFVLGCDGANSTVRCAIGARYDDLGFEQRWLVVDVETAADLGQWEGVHQVCDRRRAATYMRVGPTRYRWEFQLRDGEAASDFADIGDLLPLLRPWTGPTPPEDLDLVRVAEYTFRAQVADRWGLHGVFLLGDAAHLTPPFIGQGMGAGLRDAANLSWKLAAVLHGRLPTTFLATYEAERRPHAASLVHLARTMGLVMTAGGRTGDLARRLISPQLVRIPVLRERLVESRTPALAVGGERHRRDRLAGSLAPNLSPGGSEARSLDALVGHAWAVVSLEAVAPSDRSALERLGCAVVTVEPASPMGRWLAGGRAKAAVVRPDRTVQSSDPLVSLCCSVAITALTYGSL